MGEVASSYVTIIPKISDNFGKQLETQMRKSSAGAFGPVDQESKRAGEKAGKTFGSSFGTSFSAGKALLASTAVVAITRYVGDAVTAFSSLEDATDAASVVFGDSMSIIQKQADGAAKSIFMSKKEAIDAAITFGTFGKSAGLTGDDLAGFSTEMVQLAGDMASFRGTSTEQSIEAIGAALRGETEPIRAYGVMLDDATLRQEALSMGIIKSTKEALTPQQKVLAAQRAILKQTTDAQGDAARTADSTANVQKRLTKETENFNAAMGAKLAPTIVEVQQGLSNLMGVAEDNNAVLGPLTDTARGLATAFNDVTKAMSGGTEAGKLLKPFLDAINNITGVKPLQDLANAYTGWSGSADKATDAAKDNTTATKDADGATKSITETLADNNKALQTNADALQKVIDNRLKLRGDKRSLEAAIDGATESVKKNGKTLDIHTEKGRANQQALDDIATAGKAVGGNMDHSRKAFIKAATQMGLSKKAADKLATSLGLIKSQDVTVKVRFTQAEANFKIGLDYFGHKAALGGAISGGVRGVDSVPVLAMDGEHMFDTEDVRLMGGQQAVYRFRAALKSGRRMATGGGVGSAGSASLGPSLTVNNIGADAAELSARTQAAWRHDMAGMAVQS
jgi:hypothetical protein